MIVQFKDKKIRKIIKDGQIYYSAADICDILGFTNHHQAVKNNCFSEGVLKEETLTEGGMQKLIYLTEGNVYALILAIPKNSKKEKWLKHSDIKEFQKWVCNDVLTSIRKTGEYCQKSDVEQSILKHVKRDTQIQNSKTINSILFALGGKDSVIAYNRENCQMTTGLSTKQMKSLGDKLGIKSKSSKEVCRNISEFKTKACVMSLNDDLVCENPDLSKEMTKLNNIDKVADVLFQEIDTLIGINLKK